MRFERQIAASAIALTLAACGSAPPAEAERESGPPVRVQTETLAAGAVAETIPLTGVVRARRETTIAAQVMGYVQTVAVEEGRQVTAGQLLIELNDEPLRAAAAAAHGMWAEAEAAIVVGNQATKAAEAQLALAQATHARYQTLLSKESVSQQEYDVAEAQLRSAEAALEQARAQIAQAEAKQRQADAQIASAETMLGYARIAAPMAGVVTRRLVDPGDLASPGMPLLEIEGTGEYRLEVPIPESLISTVRVGQEVGVSIEALGENGPQQGRIAQIDPSATDASRTFLAKVALTGTGLRSGLYGQMLLPGGDRDALSVPESAVETRGQIRSVFTVEDGAAHRRLVTLGELAGGRYEVLSGLATGDRVVVDPAGVTDGAAVEDRP